jgi:hypothetical protein
MSRRLHFVTLPLGLPNARPVEAVPSGTNEICPARIPFPGLSLRK